MAGGRPKKITKTYYEECYDLAKMGLSVESICNIMKIDRQTAYNDKEFIDIYKKGNSECGKKVRALLFQRAEIDTTACIYLDKVLNKTTEKSHDDNIELKRENLKLEREKVEHDKKVFAETVKFIGSDNLED